MMSLRDLPKLVRDSKLKVIVNDNITIHTEPLGCPHEVSPQTWELKKTIGRGGDGTVFLQRKVKGPGTMDLLAVKQMTLRAELTSQDHNSKRYVRELEALAKFAQVQYSRYFVRSYGWYQDEEFLYICMEYCKHRDLGRYLGKDSALPEEHARVIAKQVLQGLERMHQNKIAHRDVKPANILVQQKPPDDEWWVVLGDLGLSRRSGASSGTTTIRGTRDFMAPETIGKPFLGLPKDADPFRADMWSLGETISCALTGRGTFLNQDHLLEYQNNQTSFPDDALKESKVSAEAIDFVRSLMAVDPARRLTVEEALRDPWITMLEDPTSHSQLPIVTAGDGLSNDQITQASGKSTQTVPMRLDDTQASGAWTKTTANPGLQRSIPSTSDQIQVGQQTSDTAADQKRDEPAVEQASSKAERFLRESDRRREEANGRRSLKAKDDTVIPFKDLSADEKLVMTEKQRQIALNNKKVKLNDLKKFSKSFRLSTPVPPDLVPIMANDKEKQDAILSSSIQRLNELDLLKEAQAQPDRSSVPVPPTPPQIRLSHVPPSNSALPAADSSLPPRPQPHRKAVSGTQIQAKEVAAPPTPTRWEEAVRRQETIAGVSKGSQTSEGNETAIPATAPSTSEAPKAQEAGKKKKQRRGK